MRTRNNLFKYSLPKGIRVISVTSGKGGVGKTNIVINLAIAFAKMKQKVMVLDADLGFSTIDTLLGLKSKYNIYDLLHKNKSLSDIIVEGPYGIKIIPSSSNINRLGQLSMEEKLELLSKFDDYEEEIDLLLLDTGTGINSNVIYFNIASQEIMVVSSPETTSLVNAYSLIKVLAEDYEEKYFKFLVNKVENEKEAIETYKNLIELSDRYLNVSIDYCGFIYRDENIQESLKTEKAVIDLLPESPASKSFFRVANKLLNENPSLRLKGNIQFFWKSMLDQYNEINLLKFNKPSSLSSLSASFN